MKVCEDRIEKSVCQLKENLKVYQLSISKASDTLGNKHDILNQKI
jgi:hypothetical protein